MYNNKNEIGVYAPIYYSDFKCIANRCRHSCCIDWEIRIDECTYEKYSKTEEILSTVKQDDCGAYFALNKDGRCPHLNGDGLCNIILAKGEDFLSEICQNHPRFFNRINETRTEAGLGIVCEEACRLILENEKPFSLSKIEGAPAKADNCFKPNFNPIPARDDIISVVESAGKFDEKLTHLKMRFNLPEIHTANTWLDRLLTLEILDTAWERDLKIIKNKPFQENEKASTVCDKYYKRLLSYFVYRHLSVAENESNLRARLAFCILSVEIIRLLFENSLDTKLDIAASTAPEGLIDWARRYSAEIEYSEDNTDELIFIFEGAICREN